MLNVVVGQATISWDLVGFIDESLNHAPVDG